MTLASQNRRALGYLGIAIAVSVVLSIPVEQVTHSTSEAGGYWFLNSCDGAVSRLNLGLIAQAILTPLLVFLLPGPGSIFQRKVVRSTRLRLPQAEAQSTVSTTVVALALIIICPLMLLRGIFVLTHFHPDSTTLLTASVVLEMVVEVVAGALGMVAAIYLLRAQVSWQPALFFAAGLLFAAAIPVAWWYEARAYAASQGVCSALFDISRPADPFHFDFVADCRRYFIFLSGFAALWIGITAGGLRLQAAGAAEAGKARSELRLFQNFFWAYVLGWAVQYRIGQWLCLEAFREHQEWLTAAFLNFIFVPASTLWSLAFIRRFWKWRLRWWWANVAVAFGGTFVIYLLTLLTFFWLMIWAPLTLAPLYRWNVSGAAWALMVGTWRWLALQKEQAVSATVAATATASATTTTATTTAATTTAAAVATPGAIAATRSPSSGRKPELSSLRAVEIVAAGIGVFLLLALAHAIYVALFVLNKGRLNR